MSSRASFVIYTGGTYQVEWYFDAEGGMPGNEFYLGMTEREKARFMVLVEHLANARRGTFLPGIHYNIEDAPHGIYAFKPHSGRLLNFMAFGNKIIVTNGFRKQSQKPRGVDREQIKKAIRLKNDYEKRVNEGVYYENIKKK